MNERAYKFVRILTSIVVAVVATLFVVNFWFDYATNGWLHITVWAIGIPVFACLNYWLMPTWSHHSSHSHDLTDNHHSADTGSNDGGSSSLD